MISFNDPIRQAGIRALIKNAISQNFKYMLISVEEGASRIQELVNSITRTSLYTRKSYEALMWLIYENKIRSRVRIFEFINRGILKLWIGG